MLSTREQSPPWSCWLHCFWYKPGCHWLSWQFGHTAGSCSACCQLTLPDPFPLHSLPATLPQSCGIACGVTKVWNPALGPVELLPIGLSPAIRPVQVPLKGIPTPWQIDTSFQLGVICKPAEGALNPFIQVINKDTEQDRPQYWPLGNTTHDWSQLVVTLWTWPSSQFLIQQRVYLFKPQADSFSRRILWEIELKALLKPR